MARGCLNYVGYYAHNYVDKHAYGDTTNTTRLIAAIRFIILLREASSPI